MKNVRFIIIIIFCFIFMQSVIGQTKTDFNLGQGVVIFSYPSIMDTSNHVVFYKDKNCTVPLQVFALENTNCPTCMLCAEPQNYYDGILKPFICSSLEGIVFICEQQDSNKYEVFIDTLGNVAYVPKTAAIQYQSWETYMVKQGERGEYISFIRQWDSTVIYDKKYDLNYLPKADSNRFVGVKINDLDDVRFYPVSIDNYWMKIKGVRSRKTTGYYWVIWRNEKNWLVNFTFRADE